MATFKDAIDTILHHEGGLVNHPKDPGGITNYGISLRALQQLNDLAFDIDCDGALDADDIKGLTVEQAKEFYEKHYWSPVFNNIISQKVATKYFDMCVNMGQRQATLIVQRAVNTLTPIGVDGLLGSKTLEAINSASGTVLLNLIQNQQVRFYVALVRKEKNLGAFLIGWLNRALYEG